MHTENGATLIIFSFFSLSSLLLSNPLLFLPSFFFVFDFIFDRKAIWRANLTKQLHCTIFDVHFSFAFTLNYLQNSQLVPFPWCAKTISEFSFQFSSPFQFYHSLYSSENLLQQWIVHHLIISYWVKRKCSPFCQMIEMVFLNFKFFPSTVNILKAIRLRYI